jgi:hypothetical protein
MQDALESTSVVEGEAVPEIWKRISDRMEELGMEPEELARKVGVDMSAISHLDLPWNFRTS